MFLFCFEPFFFFCFKQFKTEAGLIEALIKLNTTQFEDTENRDWTIFDHSGALQSGLHIVIYS